MDINNLLFNMALADVWSNPGGDKNAVFKSNKITSNLGAINTYPLPYNQIDLPIANQLYMLIELGQVEPISIGITSNIYGWVSLNAIISTFQTLTIIFSQGRFFSLYGSYIKIMPDNNIILALNYTFNQKVLSLNDDIYVRFYTNIFYEGNAATSAQTVKTGSFIVNNNYSDYLTFTALIANYAIHGTLDANGHPIPPLLFKNGLLMLGGLPLFSALHTGDVIDYIVDPFITMIDLFPIGMLNNYLSTNDNCNKLILSVNALDNQVYVADTEIFVVGTKSDGSMVGTYFPRLSPSIVRMLTYKDWSINSQLLTTRIGEMENFSDINQTLTNVMVLLLRRDNNQFKPTLLDSNYIPDLMNLPNGIKEQCLSGINANLPIWNANNLEVCPFNKWIAVEESNLASAPFYGVYSRYGAITYLERVRQLPGNTAWSLPAIASNLGGHLITYNIDGTYNAQTTYQAIDLTNITYSNGFGYEVFLPSLVTYSNLDTVIAANSTTVVTMPSGFGIFCYYLNGNTLVYANHNSDYTLTETTNGTTVTWNPTLIQHERYVRTSLNYINYTSNINQSNIEAGIDIYNGMAMAHDIGMGNLYIWFNGHYLIEGLDYVVYNSRAYICSNNNYYTSSGLITVVYCGLPDPSLQHVNSAQFGFVKHGKLFNNNIYELLLYRNNQFFVDGRAFTYSELREKEAYTDVVNTTASLGFNDGNPFAIINYPSFVRSETLDVITPTLIAEQAQDQLVSQFLSQIDPQTPISGTVTITQKYVLVSTLMNRLIELVSNNTIVITQSSYTNDQVAAMVNPYISIINTDPCFFGLDPNYVTITPTWGTAPVTVNLNQYNFLTQANMVLLNNLVEGLHLYLTIQ